MAKKADKNHTSFGFWMFALFIMAMPCIGMIMIIVWAFWGDDESRKNYFRALIAWFCLLGLFGVVMMSIGLLPQIQDQIHLWLQGLVRTK